jgi:hypothetical protein
MLLIDPNLSCHSKSQMHHVGLIIHSSQRMRKFNKSRVKVKISRSRWWWKPDLITESLIWELLQSRLFSECRMVSANFSVNFYLPMTLLRYIHQNWSLEHLRVEPMFSSYPTSIRLLVLLNRLNCTNRWHWWVI